jgi:DNA polymerase-3 subunit chi
MGIVMFYHLTRSTPAQTLLSILPRAAAMGWRVMVRGGDLVALTALDTALWTGPNDTFLAHGMAGAGPDADQPILLGQGPMAADMRALALVDRAVCTLDEAASLERVWIIFDGADDAALALARDQWRGFAAAGLAAQYWSEDTGQWLKKTEIAAKSTD